MLFHFAPFSLLILHVINFPVFANNSTTSAPALIPTSNSTVAPDPNDSPGTAAPKGYGQYSCDLIQSEPDQPIAVACTLFLSFPAYEDIPQAEDISILHFGGLHNKIVNLTNGILDNATLITLETLEMYGCGIQLIEADAFKEGESITHLDLSQNKIQTLDPNVFKYLTNLFDLKLSRNPLKHFIPEASPLFPSIPLKKLMLSHCRLSHLQPGIFANLKELQILDLLNNSLSSVDVKLLNPLTQLKRIDFKMNPWFCNCNIKYLADFLDKIKLQSRSGYQNATCIMPLKPHPKIGGNKSANSSLISKENHIKNATRKKRSAEQIANQNLTVNLLPTTPRTPIATTSTEAPLSIDSEPIGNNSTEKVLPNLKNLEESPSNSSNHVNLKKPSSEEPHSIQTLPLTPLGQNKTKSLANSTNLHHPFNKTEDISNKNRLISKSNSTEHRGKSWSDYLSSQNLSCSGEQLKANVSTFFHGKIEGACREEVDIFYYPKPAATCLGLTKFPTAEDLPDGQILQFLSLDAAKNSEESMGNRIETLPNLALDGANLTSLVRLDLARVGLKKIERHAFRGLIPIKILHLGWNQIKLLDPSIFLYLRNLETLFLDRNPLEEISGVFPSLPISQLDLRDCRLSYFETGMFDNLKNLKELHLSNNSLATFDWWNIKPLANLKVISLELNPWLCDCRLQFLLDYLKSVNRWQSDHDSINCTNSTPAVGDNAQVNVTGKAWKELSGVNLTCLPVVTEFIKFTGDEEEDKSGGKGKETVIFDCSFIGYPEPKLTWLKDGKAVNASEKKKGSKNKMEVQRKIWKMDEDEAKYNFEFRQVLTVREMEENGGKVYECVVNNAAGNSSEAVESGKNREETTTTPAPPQQASQNSTQPPKKEDEGGMGGGGCGKKGGATSPCKKKQDDKEKERKERNEQAKAQGQNNTAGNSSGGGGGPGTPGGGVIGGNLNHKVEHCQENQEDFNKSGIVEFFAEENHKGCLLSGNLTEVCQVVPEFAWQKIQSVWTDTCIILFPTETCKTVDEKNLHVGYTLQVLPEEGSNLPFFSNVPKAYQTCSGFKRKGKSKPFVQFFSGMGADNKTAPQPFTDIPLTQSCANLPKRAAGNVSSMDSNHCVILFSEQDCTGFNFTVRPHSAINLKNHFDKKTVSFRSCPQLPVEDPMEHSPEDIKTDSKIQKSHKHRPKNNDSGEVHIPRGHKPHDGNHLARNQSHSDNQTTNHKATTGNHSTTGDAHDKGNHSNSSSGNHQDDNEAVTVSPKKKKGKGTKKPSKKKDTALGNHRIKLYEDANQTELLLDNPISGSCTTLPKLEWNMTSSANVSDCTILYALPYCQGGSIKLRPGQELGIFDKMLMSFVLCNEDERAEGLEDQEELDEAGRLHSNATVNGTKTAQNLTDSNGTANKSQDITTEQPTVLQGATVNPNTGNITKTTPSPQNTGDSSVTPIPGSGSSSTEKSTESPQDLTTSSSSVSIETTVTPPPQN